MKITENNKAISEIMGTILLVVIAITAFTAFYFYFFSAPAPDSGPYVKISGMVEGNNIVITHRGGEPLDLNTEIKIFIGGDEYTMTAEVLLDTPSKVNNLWNIGERVVYPTGDITGKKVEVRVTDVERNVLVMTGILQYAS